MRKDSQFEQNEIYIIAAAVAAHADNLNEGFRQKDIKFLIEMFSNFMDFFFEGRSIQIHNTQVMRYLESLTKEGWMIATRGDTPRYRLSPIGLLSLVSRLVNSPPSYPLEKFYFIYHFLETYRPPIEELLRGESKQLPSAIRVELDFLLDTQKILDTHIRHIEHEVRKLKQRIVDSDSVVKIIKKARESKKITKDIVAEIERQFPYDLNSQKPLSEFYQEIPPHFQDFILNTAIAKRTKQIWRPVLKLMEGHLENLKELQLETKKEKRNARTSEL